MARPVVCCAAPVAWPHRREVQISLAGKTEWLAGDRAFVEVYVAEFGLPCPRAQRPKARCPPMGSSSVGSQVALPSGVKSLTTGSKSMALGEPKARHMLTRTIREQSFLLRPVINGSCVG